MIIQISQASRFDTEPKRRYKNAFVACRWILRRARYRTISNGHGVRVNTAWNINTDMSNVALRYVQKHQEAVCISAVDDLVADELSVVASVDARPS